jgi:hypothetical protein
MSDYLNSSRPSGGFVVLGALLIVGFLAAKFRSRLYAKSGLRVFGLMQDSAALQRVTDVVIMFGCALVVVGAFLFLFGD